MKIPCRTCGIHFPKDFEETFKPICNFWGDSGMTNIDVELKKKIWDWIFQLPSDEIWLKTGLGIWLTFGAVYVPREKTFYGKFPEFENMTEEEQQAFEKDHFRNARQENEIDNLKKPENIVTVSKTKN